MARPTPSNNSRRALFGWLTGKELSKWAPAGASDLTNDAGRIVAEIEAVTL